MTTADASTVAPSALAADLQFRFEPHPSPATEELRRGTVERPVFGRHFSDHMAIVDWTVESGWCDSPGAA